MSGVTSVRRVAAAALAGAVSMAFAAGQQPAAGVFTAEQAAAGRATYTERCASCHVADLRGRNEAPELAGANFLNAWRARTTRDLTELIQTTMPPGGANLTAEQVGRTGRIHPRVERRRTRTAGADHDRGRLDWRHRERPAGCAGARHRRSLHRRAAVRWRADADRPRGGRGQAPGGGRGRGGARARA